jgi:hypothetical protein
MTHFEGYFCGLFVAIIELIVIDESKNRGSDMDAQDFVELFKNEEFKTLLVNYYKFQEPLALIRGFPQINTKRYRGWAWNSDGLEQEVARKQAVLGAYLIRVLETPAVKVLLDGVPPQDAMDY